MTVPGSMTVTPVFVGDLHVEGERMPIYVHVIDHPDGRVLVDTGMTQLHPLLADMEPRLRPLSEQDFEGQLLIHSLEPELVWLAHEHQPWRPPSRR